MSYRCSAVELHSITPVTLPVTPVTLPLVLQIEDAAQVPAGHSLLDTFAGHCDYHRKEMSDCGIIVLKLNMLRLAGYTETPLDWLLPVTAQQKRQHQTCVVQVTFRGLACQPVLATWFPVCYYAVLELQFLEEMVWQ